MLSIPELRASIDDLDDRIVDLVADRVALARAIGEAKQASGLAVTDPAREAEVVARATVRAAGRGLDDRETRALFWRLLALCRRAQLVDEAPLAPAEPTSQT